MVAQVFQALVLLEFSENDQWTVEDLKQRTKIPDEEITRAIQSLAFGKIKILNRTNKPDEKVTVVNDDDIFEFNQKFKYKGYKIKIGQVVIRENKKEKKQVDENIQANRQIQLDALIVRTMKAKKKMSHSALINELFANVRFPLNANDAKK